jgi:hypothetical protein
MLADVAPIGPEERSGSRRREFDRVPGSGAIAAGLPSCRQAVPRSSVVVPSGDQPRALLLEAWAAAGGNVGRSAAGCTAGPSASFWPCWRSAQESVWARSRYPLCVLGGVQRHGSAADLGAVLAGRRSDVPTAVGTGCVGERGLRGGAASVLRLAGPVCQGRRRCSVQRQAEATGAAKIGAVPVRT